MKTFALTAAALLAAIGAAHAADYATKAPLSIEIVAPATPAAPPLAVVAEKLTVYGLLNDGWQPVKAALIPTSGVPGTRGQLAHTDGQVVMLYKDGVYVYCAIAQAGGTYNNCHVAGPGTR
ncbi:hypothetical protein [Azorhizobium doebereinerae]|uniref:hypothetical protein n=1 Tax=Azorhizobium doebereinerae TaxID=281091 RepID=UPI0003F4CA1A|nr:hypothetical protein [Azorhizobium doebereinerae]